MIVAVPERTRKIVLTSMLNKYCHSLELNNKPSVKEFDFLCDFVEFLSKTHYEDQDGT